MSSTVSLEEWYDLTEPYHLHIKDIVSMSIGDRKKILLLDRNFFDPFDYPRRRTYTIKQALKKMNVVEYIHIHQLAGIAKWLSPDQDTLDEPFEFDIGIPKPPTGDDHYRFLGVRHGRAQVNPHTRSYDVDTLVGACLADKNLKWKVGWRGPCIPLEALEKLPAKFYVAPEP